MKFKLKNLKQLFKNTAKAWWNKDPFSQSAVLAYYALFAIPGLLFLIITSTKYFFGEESVSKNLIKQVSETMGPEIAAQINEILISVGKTNSTVLGSLIGITILIIGATGVFTQLQKNLNLIWHVKLVPTKGFVRIAKARLFSFGLILAISFLLLISLVVSTALAGFSDLITVDSSGFVTVLFIILNFLISLGVVSVLFALIFKILPDAKLKWKHVWLGAFVTGLLFTLGKTALAFYFGKASPASAYGAAGSIILILLWTSYSSMILFFWAEFTSEYTKMYAGEVAPSEIAKKSTKAKKRS